MKPGQTSFFLLGTLAQGLSIPTSKQNANHYPRDSPFTYEPINTGYVAFGDSYAAGIGADTTFYYWQPGHHFFHRPGNWAYLLKPLRTELNKLVTDLNAQLNVIISNVNKDFLEPRVLFADPNPAFDGHRFCEEGITEPDPNNQDNWLFLASWPDNSLPGTDSAALSAASEAAQSSLSGQSIPDAATCASSHD
ncbi:hypothetical protein MBLNU459_g6551t1 [Dothideomycetes sp. NU459]